MARNPYVTLDHVIGILDPTPVTQEVIDSIGSHFSPGVVDNGALAFHSPNLLTNFDSFEQFYDADPLNKTLLGPSGRTVGGVDIEETIPITIIKAEVVNTRKFHGENSLEIECSVDNIGYKYINPYTSAATDWIVINEAGSYIFSYYIYTTANTAINGAVQLHSYAAASTLGSASFDGVKQSDGWIRKFIKFTTTSPNTATIRININTPGATIYLDALQLEKSDGVYPSAFGPGGQTVISGGNITTNSIKANQLSSNFGEFANTLTVGTSPNVVVITGIAGGGEGARIYTGVGEFNNTNTPFFLGGTTGKFSLSNKLSFDGTNLSVTGAINATSGNFINTVNIGSSTTDGFLSVGRDTNKILIDGKSTSSTTAIHNTLATDYNIGTGFWLDATGRFSLKGANGSLLWDGSNLNIQGSVATGGATGYNTTGAWLGSDGKFSLKSGTNSLLWNGTDLSLTGAINASSGDIAGWLIGTDEIYKGTGAGKIALNSAATPKIYNGAGNHGSADTGFYIDANGQFSLKNQLIFTPGTDSNNLSQLQVVGKIQGIIDPVSFVPNSKLYTTPSTLEVTSNVGVITTVAAHSILPNEKIIIEGATPAALNGIYTVSASTTTTITITTSGILDGSYNGVGGSITLKELTMGLHQSEGTGSYYHDTGTGLRLDKYNWWFTNNQFRVGTSGAYLRWNGTTLDIQGGSDKKLKLGVGAANIDNYFAITTASAPNYSNSDTPFYVDGDGKFSLSDKLTWDGNTLNITGNLSVNSTFETNTGSTSAQNLLNDIATKEESIIRSVAEPYNTSIINGNFIDTLDKWTASGGTATLLDDGVSIIGNGGQNFIEIAQDPASLSVEANDKVYIYTRLKPLNSSDNVMLVAYNSNEVSETVTNPTPNTEYKLSRVFSYPTAGTYKVASRATYADPGTALNKVLEVYRVLAINLTETFGAGNEPSKAFMDSYIFKLWLDISAIPNVLKRFSGESWVKTVPTTADEVGAFDLNDGTALQERVTAAELKITPEAITSVVEANTTTLATRSYVQTTAEDTKIAAEQQIRDEYGNTINDIQTNFIFDTSGLTISKSTSEFAVKIDNTEMGFYEGSTKTAYVNNGEFFINKGSVVSSLTIGSHKIEKYSNGITIFRFIG